MGFIYVEDTKSINIFNSQFLDRIDTDVVIGKDMDIIYSIFFYSIREKLLYNYILPTYLITPEEGFKAYWKYLNYQDKHKIKHITHIHINHEIIALSDIVGFKQKFGQEEDANYEGLMEITLSPSAAKPLKTIFVNWDSDATRALWTYLIAALECRMPIRYCNAVNKFHLLPKYLIEDK